MCLAIVIAVDLATQDFDGDAKHLEELYHEEAQSASSAGETYDSGMDSGQHPLGLQKGICRVIPGPR